MAHLHEKIDFTVTAFIVHQNKVLLILHKKLGLWLPVGGHIELDEDPEEALLREVKEECGLDVKIFGSKPEIMTDRTKFLYTPAFLDIHKISDSHQHIGLQYFCTTESDEFTINHDELDDARWFSLDEIEASPDLIPEIKFYATEAIQRISENK